MQTFKEDLEAGKILEEHILKKVKRRYPDAYIIDGYFKDWDIYIPEINQSHFYFKFLNS